jgi:hypothetical protein
LIPDIDGDLVADRSKVARLDKRRLDTTNGARSAERARGAGWTFVSAPRRVLDPGGDAMQRAVHAATTIPPHLRRGLTAESAGSADPALRVLTGAD